MCEGYCYAGELKFICRKCGKEIVGETKFRVYMCYYDNNWGNFCLECDRKYGEKLRGMQYSSVEESDYPLWGLYISGPMKDKSPMIRRN